MENLDRDRLSDREGSESQSDFGQKIGQFESWDSEPSRKSGSGGIQSESSEKSSSEDIDDPACSGCYH